MHSMTVTRVGSFLIWIYSYYSKGIDMAEVIYIDSDSDNEPTPDLQYVESDSDEEEVVNDSIKPEKVGKSSRNRPLEICS